MNNEELSISDYLKWVKDCHYTEFEPNGKYTFRQEHVYFRGHASTSWELVPSLFRDNWRTHNEHSMLIHANNYLWAELCDCKSELEKMIRLQHYGLHTRLLDVTYNPLVALYFACQRPMHDEDNKDGIVYCGNKEITEGKEGIVVAEYIFRTDALNSNGEGLERLCNQYNVRKESLEKAHIINPPYNNQRIKIQSGSFIMPPLLQKDGMPPSYYANRSVIRREIEKMFSKKCIIPNSCKEAILKELDYLGFNKATIFKDISNILEYINDKENGEWPIIDLT